MSDVLMFDVKSIVWLVMLDTMFISWSIDVTSWRVIVVSPFWSPHGEMFVA